MSSVQAWAGARKFCVTCETIVYSPLQVIPIYTVNIMTLENIKIKGSTRRVKWAVFTLNYVVYVLLLHTVDSRYLELHGT